MTIEQRVDKHERLINALISRLNNDKFYDDADKAGLRQNITQVTPYTATKKAYLGDTELIFEAPIDGNLSVFVRDTEGKEPAYTAEKDGKVIRITFAPLEYITTVTISIL